MSDYSLPHSSCSGVCLLIDTGFSMPGKTTRKRYSWWDRDYFVSLALVGTQVLREIRIVLYLFFILCFLCIGVTKCIILPRKKILFFTTSRHAIYLTNTSLFSILISPLGVLFPILFHRHTHLPLTSSALWSPFLKNTFYPAIHLFL